MSTTSSSARSEAVFEGANCRISIQRPADNVVLIAIVGRDLGELGDAPFYELEKDMNAEPFHLFIDARATMGASIDVSNEWAQWLRRGRKQFRSVHMLAGSRFIQVTAYSVCSFAELGDLMRVYTDTIAFEEEFLRAKSGQGILPSTPWRR